MRMRLNTRHLLTLPAIAAAALASAWWWPKSCSLPIHPRYIGYYRGLGLGDGPGYFGKNYFKVTLPPTEPNDGITEVFVQGEGFNGFRGEYLNGVIREEGECYVEWADLGWPCPDLHRVRNARYYRPDGSLGSEVKDGTGVQIYWSRNGVKLWEAKLVGSECHEIKSWTRQGEQAFVWSNGNYFYPSKDRR